MAFNTGLSLNQIITNEELIKIFKCGSMSGMRTSKATNTLTIISDYTKGLYDDKWIGDVLHYTGMGKSGDQDINYRQNRTLNESNENNVDVFLFEVFKVNSYIYRGQVKLVDIPYKEKQKDVDGNLRNVWFFPVKPIDEHIITIDENIIKENYNNKEKKAKKLTDKELKEKAEESQYTKTSVRIITFKTYERNAFVTEYAKRRANGKCQLCNRAAPFTNKFGEPYLEIHHIEWLSKGGADTIENTVALCPNCHKKMHVVDNNLDKTYLKNISKNS
ncbi:HNH endonuclease signature motif containing protein [Clostridium sp. ATCC 25772]|uniref:HNH endonuclease n=1 Tax=Clostridium sp. ATCC 25772 TaxID=1676991 RepID=UPI000780E731|nr:HNH endonuclease signature motif containing protein [Clostridium sp. ATCC 25772]